MKTSERVHRGGWVVYWSHKERTMNPITATDRAHQINAANAARCAARGVEPWGELVTDAAHWAEYGIHTGAELDLYLVYCDYVEAYKDAYGIKPRWMRMEDRTAEEWQQMLEAL